MLSSGAVERLLTEIINQALIDKYAPCPGGICKNVHEKERLLNNIQQWEKDWNSANEFLKNSPLLSKAGINGKHLCEVQEKILVEKLKDKE